MRHIKEEDEKEEANIIRQQIEAIKKENYHLMAQEEGLKKSEQMLDSTHQSYIYGIYQRRLGPIERENALLLKKVNKCEENIENLKNKCEKVKERYPSSSVEKLRIVQDRFSECLQLENSLKQEVDTVEKQITQVREIPKQNPDLIIAAIAEINLQIEREKGKHLKLEIQIKQKQQDLKLAKLTIPKTNGSHSLYKEIELLSCILVDKMSEVSKVTEEIDFLQNKLNL